MHVLRMRNFRVLGFIRLPKPNKDGGFIILSLSSSISLYLSLSLLCGAQPPKKQQPAKGGKTPGKGKDAGKKAKPSGSGGKAKKKVSWSSPPHETEHGPST